MKPPSGAVVYFVQAGEYGAIKIGTTTNWARDRIAALQTGSPEELRLLVWIPGSTQTEREMHERFAALHLRGEWFKPGFALLQFINDIERGIARAKSITAARREPVEEVITEEERAERDEARAACARETLAALGLNQGPPGPSARVLKWEREQDAAAELASVKADNARLREQLQRLDDARDAG